MSSSDGAAPRLGVAGALGLSVTSSVAIVICNKYLISTLGFFFAPAVLRGEADRCADCHLLWAAQWHLHWPPQPLPWIQLCWLLSDEQAGHYTLHHALGDHLSEQEVQPEHQGLSHGPPPRSRHRICHRSPAQPPRLDHRRPHHRRDVRQPDSDQPNPEEAQGVVHPAAVPVVAVPVRRPPRHRPVRRQAPHQARRLRLQLHLPSRGVHCAVVLDSGVRELQHVPGDRDDVAGDVPGAGAPQDVPDPLLRLRATQGPLHLPQRRRHPHRHLRHGPLLLLLRLREPQEGRGPLSSPLLPDGGGEGRGAAAAGIGGGGEEHDGVERDEGGGAELRRGAEDGEERVQPAVTEMNDERVSSSARAVAASAPRQAAGWRRRRHDEM